MVGWLVGPFCKIPFRVSSKIFILTNFLINIKFDKHKAGLSYKKRRAIGTPLFL
ncbi:hypothetical protein E9G_03304 [Moraxella catarrhalis 7169]|nr:hypothetical protein E9G_03304 [Moraxella catarrhalis 7169]